MSARTHSSMLTPWNLTRAEFRFLYEFRSTLSKEKTVENLHWSVDSFRVAGRTILPKFGVDHISAVHVMFDRWATANPDEIIDIRLKMGL